MSVVVFALALLAGLALIAAPLPRPRVTKPAGAALVVAGCAYLAVDLGGDGVLWVAVPLGAFALVASALHLQTRFPSPGDTQRLQEQCHALARALTGFLAERELADAAARARWHALPGDATAGDRERAYRARVEQILQHRQRTIALYDDRYRDAAARLAADAGASRGERDRAEHPGTPGGIREVAQMLAYVGLDPPAAPATPAAARERAPRRLARSAPQTL